MSGSLRTVCALVLVGMTLCHCDCARLIGAGEEDAGSSETDGSTAGVGLSGSASSSAMSSSTTSGQAASGSASSTGGVPDAGSFCEGSGPALAVGETSTGAVCGGELAQTTFTFALHLRGH